MKPSILPHLTGLLVLLSSCQAQAQGREATEKISKEFTIASDASRNVLALYNIDGAVTVQGYDGNKVVIEATKIISADDPQTLELGKKEAQLGFLQRGDSIVAYTAAPYDSRPHNGRGNWNHKEIDYHYTFNYVVKVPRQLNLHVSTVNNGKLTIQDVTGKLEAYNVNGAIALTNVRGTTKAHTVNGNVEASYVASPNGASSYHTINGQIIVSYPKDVSADVHFKSMHGELFTDFPNVETLPAQVTQNKQNSGNGTRYKLNKDTAMRLGKGGKDFRFETLNGDVTIKQQTK
ncbi:DUF4097 family beta strand repeat-containing protein [Hymenobacter crusticola]|uniref:Adhesin domain-containing protein n=1 Tax=Hymenobacter crusticola TaxID=1770526 RepID=A0A243WAC1_9BACT|nr:hypothetical protein [Hymenobacter crusticola]OUJ72320.1 hypothetical protein BXP70_18855 [Hymenobacter crusticola]